MFAYVRPWIWLRSRASSALRNFSRLIIESPSGRN